MESIVLICDGCQELWDADGEIDSMERVIFLDRDGTLNEEVNYLHRREDLRILEGVPEAIRRFREAGYRIVVVTNQAGVARGYYSEEDVHVLHQYMNELLRAEGAAVDHFFYCPHHPEHGIGEYKKACHCRKPETGMFEMTEQYYTVDKKHSWMIGDKLIDVQAGRNYGVRTALVGTGYGAKEHEAVQAGQEHTAFPVEMGHADMQAQMTGGQPYDIYAETLLDAAKEILKG